MDIVSFGLPGIPYTHKKSAIWLKKKGEINLKITSSNWVLSLGDTYAGGKTTGEGKSRPLI